MPLFMDFHKEMDNLSLEDLKKAHEADEHVQGKYHVKYCKFWVNQHTGNVFCLIEAPDIDSCIKVHREAHPDYMACAIIEVDQEFVDLTMGQSHKVDGGIVREESGKLDLGYRTVLMVDVADKIAEDSRARKNHDVKSVLRGQITQLGGRLLEVAADDVISAVFSSAAQAVQCATAIHSFVKIKSEEQNPDWHIQCTLGVASGEPITDGKDFFEDTLRLARMLVGIGESGRINISSLANELSHADDLPAHEKTAISVLKAADETFLSKLYLAITENLAEENFNIEQLCSELGISRPQLYRKVTALTGKSTNELIRDLRMQLALNLINRQESNIAEVALRVGISNPSYFAKCFQDKYGVAPSKLYL